MNRSKRDKKSKRKTANPNRYRSESNPSSTRNDPNVNWLRYAEGRKSERCNYAKWMPRLADHTREGLGLSEGEKDRHVSVMPVALVKPEESPSC